MEMIPLKQKPVVNVSLYFVEQAKISVVILNRDLLHATSVR